MRYLGRTIRPCHLGAGSEVLVDKAQQLAAVLPVLPNAPGPPSDGQIRDQYSDHTTTHDQSEISIQITWPLLTNQRPVFTCWCPTSSWGRSRRPDCRGHPSSSASKTPGGHSSSWSGSRTSRWHYTRADSSPSPIEPIRDQYSNHMTTLDQSEISIQIT